MSASKVLQDYIFSSRYARHKKESNRRETWSESVDRVRNMMLEKYKDHKIDDLINQVYDMMKKRRVLGSQRALQYGGDPIMKKNARIYNCLASYADRPRFFQEFFWLLLCGGGCGFSVQKHHVNKLPSFSENRIKNNGKNRESMLFIVPDTIEGWADCIGVLLTTYFDIAIEDRFNKFVGKNVIFDYSQIRPKGSELSSGIGNAPGHEGLEFSIERIRSMIDERIEGGFSKLRPIDVYDICMHISDAVLSGGVRRSASLAMFSHDDLEMATAKTGNWLSENPQRARSNNSALLIRSNTTKEQFQGLMSFVKEFGEPGFIWADSTELLVNPCGEIGFFCYDIVDEEKFTRWKNNNCYDSIECDPIEIGLASGWQGCNLSTVNCSKLVGETIEQKIEYFYENVKAAAVIGTLQAGFTDLTYLGKTSENIFRREALLGVSMTGMMDNFEIVLDPAIQKKASEIVLQCNSILASILDINECARSTCLKPEGTGTLVLGCSAHGCHPHHYVRYLRAVQANRQEHVYQFFKSINPTACERSTWSSNDTDDIILFPIEVPNGAKTKNQLPATELLKIVKSTQENWIWNGKREDKCIVPWLSHNVSNTITVSPNEWDEVEDFIFENRDYFSGISLVPDSADKDYPQVPNCAVYTSRQIVKEYGDAALWVFDLVKSGLENFDNLWSACSAVLNDSFDTDVPNKAKFWNECRCFADKYFNSDYKKFTYCIKDVYNWKKWCDLSTSLAVVDYTQLTENEDNTKPEETIACGGGGCIIV